MRGATSSSESSSEKEAVVASLLASDGACCCCARKRLLCRLRRLAPRTHAATAQADAATSVTVRVVLRPPLPMIAALSFLVHC